MKKLNLLITLSMALLCATKPAQAESSWTSWIIPTLTAATAASTWMLYKKDQSAYEPLKKINDTLEKLDQIARLLANAQPENNADIKKSIKQILDTIDDGDDYATHYYRRQFKNFLPDILNSDLRHDAVNDFANIKAPTCAKYENLFRYNVVRVGYFCEHGAEIGEKMDKREPYAQIRKFAEDGTEITPTIEDYCCPAYKAYIFANYNYKLWKESLLERKHKLETPVSKHTIITSALSALTLGLVAYNYKN